jgi:hypothetical protein
VNNNLGQLNANAPTTQDAHAIMNIQNQGEIVSLHNEV